MPEIGSKLGPFTVTAVLGQGGMGAVYRARDASGGEVALKVLLGDLATDLHYRERFRREARAAESVVHRNVVACRGSGEERGALWIAFELVPGGTLKDLVRERGRIAWAEAARLGAQVARGLSAIHAKGLVHRDVKPANVLVGAGSIAKVADLGLARGHAAAQALTRTGELVGTFEYVAPEQTDDSKVDFRADLYSLGATLHELLAGRPPFEGTGVALIAQHVSAVPRSLRTLEPGIPRELDALVLRLLAKQPEARGESALAVAGELDEVARLTARRAKSAAAVVAALSLSVAAAVGLVALARSRPAPIALPPPLAPPVAAGAEPTEPLWFRRLKPARRPKTPLPRGVAFTETDDEYVDTEDRSVLVYVPPHSHSGPKGRWRVEGLFVGKYEVRNDQFRAFVGATGHVTDAEKPGRYGWVPGQSTGSDIFKDDETASWRAPFGGGKPAPDDHPAVQLDPADAQAYARWAGARLPKRDEWEAIACWDPSEPGRSVARMYPWGDDDRPDDPGGPRSVNHELLDRSAGGLVGMGSNVSEWCQERRSGIGGAMDETLFKGGSFHELDGKLVEKDKWQYKPNCATGVRIVIDEGR